MAAISIGRLADLTGIKVTTIRYYETVGLLPTPTRTAGNRRVYGPCDVERLTFIRRSREFGLSQEAIRGLLDLELDRRQPCQAATRIVATHLTEIDRKIAELEALRAWVHKAIGSCRGEKVESCAIMMTLRGRA